LPCRGARIQSGLWKACATFTRPIQEELEKFFIATDELEDKKLKILGWKGPKVAVQAIKDSAKTFAKDDD
jgi:inorganic pyrophosphatase